VILLDVNMPDIDGIETAELIRQHSKTKHTPIIFVTAYADEMQTARGYALGAVDYILSPVIPEILRSKVKVFVELYRAQKRAQALARLEAERAAAEEATQRSEFLAFASRELGASLNLDEGMERLLQMLVPGSRSTRCSRCSSRTRRSRCRAAGRGAAAGWCPGSEAFPAGAAEALREARKTELALQPSAAMPAQLRHLQVIPLHSGERTVAVLALGLCAAPGARGAADQATIDELVGRAAIAFENARLYWNLKREMARTKEAEEKLKEASRRKDEFLAMLLHELRNPLAPIRNAAEVMRASRRPTPASSGRATWWSGR
jgi:signal transduction histidine kinase